MNYQNLLIDIKDKIALVTVNRPEKMNALNSQTMNELKSVFGELKNNEDVYAVILTGSGEIAFIAGADIKELNALNMVSGKELDRKSTRLNSSHVKISYAVF